MRQTSLAFTLVAASVAAWAQPVSPLLFRIQQGNTAQTLTDGGTFAMTADGVGQAALATLAVQNRGSSPITIGNIDHTGSLEFEVTSAPDFPATLGPNQSFNVGIRFLPRSSNRQQARIGFVYSDGRVNNNAGINLTGTTPEFVFSFVPQGGNATLLPPNGTVTFPVTAIDETRNSAIVIINRGTAPGVVKAIALAGNPAFQLVGSPLPDTAVEAGRELRFNIAFTPKQLEPVNGTLAVELVGSRQTFNVLGSGTGPVYRYEYVSGDAASPVQPGSAIVIPDVAVNERSAIIVRVRNNGNADGQITQINVQGAGFTLTDVPFLPLTLQPGQSVNAGVTFAPAQAGRSNGRLRIGNDTFELTSNGLGSIVNYAYIVGPVTTNVVAGGSVSFSPAAIGRSSSVRFRIDNTGTSPAPLNSISVTGPNAVYALSDLPPLPAEVPANGSLSFLVTFTPVSLTTATGTLRIDSQSFTLNGTGSSPERIPAYRIEGASGVQEPLQQPGVGLTLESPYTLRLNGTLALALNPGAFTNDPAVQFATGGRSVSFHIPAGETRAVFPDGSNRIQLQTGTVAGTISLTPSFATEGGVNLTPDNPVSMNLTVAQSAPRILSLVVTNRTQAGFTLQITGLSTSRAVNQMNVQFTPVSGENVQTTRLEVNVASSFLAWYQSAQSQPFGSLFTLTVPFSLAGDVRTEGLALVDTIQSVSVTLANAQGTSQARSVDLK